MKTQNIKLNDLKAAMKLVDEKERIGFSEEEEGY